MKSFKVLSYPKEIFASMLADIKNAKKSIYLETYIYDDDKIGNEFKKALIKKAKQGVKIFILVDSWGWKGNVTKDYFKEITALGGKIKFFNEVRYVLRFYSANHERNHRKLLIIDNEMTYVGSINIVDLDWRELVLRIKGPISLDFSKSFMKSWSLSGKLTKSRIKTIIHKGFEIINDIPRDMKQMTESKYAKLINNAEKEILIETPYFAPPIRIRIALAKAVKRGVDVKIILPYKSDVKLMDILHNRYLGRLHKEGIKIYYYFPKVLHSKLLLVDDKFFLLGSSNLDYRSFIHNHEINLFGNDARIIKSLKEFYNSGLKYSKKFDYKQWKSRYSVLKLVEMLLSWFEHYL